MGKGFGQRFDQAVRRTAQLRRLNPDNLPAFQVLQGFQRPRNQGLQVIYPTPACDKYDDWNIPFRDILLMLQVLVERDESIEFIAGKCQTFVMVLTAPIL